jgi:glycosyltransferase involved in cell wall biosynthesis
MAPVSVVIPTFNSGHTVVEALESVLRQTVPPSEVIVVDDGSTDDTRRRLFPYFSRARYVAQRNQGVSAARNHGVRLARCEVVAFLDSDDVWHPRMVELQMRALAEARASGLVGTQVYEWPSQAAPSPGEIQTLPLREVPWKELVVRNPLTTSSVFARREILDRVGPFDDSLSGPEDHDMWLRVAEVAKVSLLMLPLVGYRRAAAGSLSKRVGAMEAGMRRILRKLDERGAWNGRRVLRRKAYSYCTYSCAQLHSAQGTHAAAIERLLRSFAWYPWPYRRCEVPVPLTRLRMLVSLSVRAACRRGGSHPAPLLQAGLS